MGVRDVFNATNAGKYELVDTIRQSMLRAITIICGAVLNGYFFKEAYASFVFVKVTQQRSFE
jgi:hypothetical protein